MHNRRTPDATPARGRLVCRTCATVPESDVLGGRRCPWCRSPLTLEFGPVLLRCVECGVPGTVDIDLFLRAYPRGSLLALRAVCDAHRDGGGPAGAGPVTTRPGPTGAPEGG